MKRVIGLVLLSAGWAVAEHAPPVPIPMQVAEPLVAVARDGREAVDTQAVSLQDAGAVTYWKESADSLADVAFSGSSGYDVVKTNVQVEGTGAFHLVHPSAVTQTILMNPVLVIGTETKLFFESRLGWASSAQMAQAELSVVGESTWHVLWSRAGTDDSGQAAFARVEVPLSDYAGQEVQIRFRYLVSGGYYPQTTVNVGWLLDDIQVGENYIIEPVPYDIGNPTALEQLSLEYINRARASAMDEAQRLVSTDDPDVLNSMSYFQVDTNLMVEQFGTLPPVAPPLVFNARLLEAARLHTQDMYENNFQGHYSSGDPIWPNEPGDAPANRVTRQGYQYARVGENVFSYAKSIWHAHAGFNIDWGGSGDGGMQDPPGHRLAIHNTNYVEIGIGVLTGSQASVGPMLITQDFGTEQGRDQPFLTGVVMEDLDADDFYSVGEGVEGVRVQVAGVRHEALSTASGGYAVPLPGDGVYAVEFSGAGLPTYRTSVTVTQGHSVKLDYRLDHLPVVQLGDSMNGNEVTFAAETGAQIHAEFSTDFVQWEPVPGLVVTDHGDGTYSLTIETDTHPVGAYRLVIEL
jgi:hypothetical protein